MQDLFVERVTDISIHQGIARIDFARLERLDPEKQQASFTPSMRLVMPVDAFLSMVEQVTKLREAVLQQVKQNPSSNKIIHD